MISCADGDTFLAEINGYKYSIRIGHIDAPESGQHYSATAKEALETLIHDLIVDIIPFSFDRYSRAVCHVFREDGLDVSKEMLRAGMAWHEKKYSRSMEHAIIEAEARLSRKGLWQDPRPVAPWIWRQTKGNIRQTPMDHVIKVKKERDMLYEWLESIEKHPGL